MKRVALVLITTILCLSLASAEPLFTIADGTSITITPQAGVEQTVIFIDGQAAAEYPQLAAGQDISIDAATGAHEVEVRSIKTYTYEWEDYNILKNDEPIYLDYVRYDKDKKRVTFALDTQEENIIHPQDVDTTQESTRVELEDYVVTMNGQAALYCYPQITTGKPVSFSCRTDEYPHTLSIEATLGTSEKKTATVATPITQEVKTPTSRGPPAPPPLPMERNPPEDVLVQNIELHDTLGESPAGIPVTIFIILLFISVMTLLFIASHHQYENKLAGKHHPHKKKKKPVAAEEPAEKEKQQGPGS